MIEIELPSWMISGKYYILYQWLIMNSMDPLLSYGSAIPFNSIDKVLKFKRYFDI